MLTAGSDADETGDVGEASDVAANAKFTMCDADALYIRCQPGAQRCAHDGAPVVKAARNRARARSLSPSAAQASRPTVPA